MELDSYKRLAQRLDSLPNGFPPAADGSELRLLANLFTPEEADLAARLRLSKETSEQIASRIGGDPQELAPRLKSMAKRGLIAAERVDGGLGYGLMPFVVGIYEMQIGRIDAELARLFEDYYQQAFGQVLGMSPPVHRVIPVRESVRVDMEIRPYESAAEIIARAQSWGVLDCICRKQKALIGEACEHPIDVCMALSSQPGAFDRSPVVHAKTQEEALETLRRAARAGLVHTVSNNQRGTWYICNCCTCSCGVLRGLSEMGIANVVARSPFVNQVDEDMCLACQDCLDYCQFNALSLDEVVHVDMLRCVGCGVCVPACPEGALRLVRRPGDEIEAVPVTEMDWLEQRAAGRGISLDQVL
jgi:H+/Na+-translocating ferredoxin:NAD+ oxidoreductase subunit B